MYSLKITGPIHWRHSWSAEIGRMLEVQDSSYDYFVFTPETTQAEILAVLAEIPDKLFQLREVESSDAADCEFWTDAGQCYHRRH